jgi:hypothetical protein
MTNRESADVSHPPGAVYVATIMEILGETVRKS